MMPKSKAYLSKIYQKVHGIVSQQFELYLIKSMKKWKPNEKLSIKM